MMDLRGCDEHGMAEVSTYRTAERGTRHYCLACRRARESATHYGGDRCRRGHLKAPWDWRKYGDHVRCVPCARASN